MIVDEKQLESINKIPGINGYAIIDRDLQVSKTDLSQKLIDELSGYCINKLMNNNLDTLEGSRGSVFMTQKAAWYITRLTDAKQQFLVILGGFNSQVDIEQLIKTGEELKEGKL